MKNVVPFLIAYLFVTSACNTKTVDSIKPNIILISADDLGWSDIGCYGSEINTPNLDRLAQEGMRFTHFHNTSKCFPSRASLITGVYAHDCGYDKTHENPITNAVTIGEILQEAGYLTYWSGKHHGKENPYTRGFNHYYGLKDGCCNYFNPGKQRPNEEKPAQKNKERYWCIDSASYRPYTPENRDFYTTDYFTNYAIDYLNEASEKGKPFFLYLAYTAPHDPLMAWPEDIEKYERRYDVGFDEIRRARYDKQLEMGLIDSSYQLSAPSFTDWEKLSKEEKLFETKKMEVYAAMIDRMDQNIGRVMDELTRLNMIDNTIIFFVSDNGASQEVVNLKDDNDTGEIGSIDRWVSLGLNWANVSNTPFRYYKNYSYEGGINTPLIAWWPRKIKENTVSNFVGHFIDIMPTIVDISDAKYPEIFNGDTISPMRGTSLVPTFTENSVDREEPLFWQWNQGSAVYLDGWKIVKHGQNNDWDLYHIAIDPTESLNLNKDYPGKVSELDSMYFKWLKNL